MSGSYSLRSLFAKEVTVEIGGKPFGFNVKKLYVPRIQRAYAQGRGREGEQEAIVRCNFLDDLFHALENGAPLELGFVYGCRNGGRLELLDGQQRLTTLYLLYWYLYKVRKERVPADVAKIFSSLVYETRATSTEFLVKLAELAYRGPEDPADYIRSFKWYTNAYEQDATVSGMLTMLHGIHERYTPGIAVENLENIRFYVLSLEELALDDADDLYVKMNARGLALTPFENFKADLVGYLERPDVLGDAAMETAAKLDGAWLDFFWRQCKDVEGVDADAECSLRFFRFFHRFLAARYIIHTTGDGLEEDEHMQFLKKRSESEQVYPGFAQYEGIFRLFGGALLEEACAVLEAFSDENVDMGVFAYPWRDPEDKMRFFGPQQDYTRPLAVVFSAVLDFILQRGGLGDTRNLERWVRVVWNVVENTNIDNLESQVLTARSLSKLCSACASGDVYARMRGVYEARRQAPDSSNREKTRRAEDEELLKAAIIVNRAEQGEPGWEERFRHAELHPFLRGMLGFIIEPEMQGCCFDHRYRMVESLFAGDGSGIAPAFQADHLLLRAIFCCFDRPGLMVGKPVNERNRDEFKRNLLTVDTVQAMFRRLTDCASVDAMSRYLEGLLEDDSVETALAGAPSVWERQLAVARKRLRTDVRLYDWMLDFEDKVFHSTYRDNHWRVSVYKSWYNHVVIDTQRDAYIRSLLEPQGPFRLENKWQEQDGFFTCISIGLLSTSLSSLTVKLIVEEGFESVGVHLYPASDTGKKDWEDEATALPEGVTWHLQGEKDWFHLLTLPYSTADALGKLHAVLQAIARKYPPAAT